MYLFFFFKFRWWPGKTTNIPFLPYEELFTFPYRKINFNLGIDQNNTKTLNPPIINVCFFENYIFVSFLSKGFFFSDTESWCLASALNFHLCGLCFLEGPENSSPCSNSQLRPLTYPLFLLSFDSMIVIFHHSSNFSPNFTMKHSYIS